ncbi:hypothetical protein ILYODFUR_013140 [Ilyodon furcidens]|uniref:Uncharacterized protein n=1 Tax=Ilyodon furcidens TaxID=33524 RepID=A0ABV0TL68_9TELE
MRRRQREQRSSFRGRCSVHLQPWVEWVTGEPVSFSSSLQARGGVHPGQVANPSQGNTETCRTNNQAHTHSHLRAI